MNIFDKKIKKNFAQGLLSANTCTTIEDFEAIIETINIMAKHLKIKKIAIARNSVIFSKINAENFKVISLSLIIQTGSVLRFISLGR